MVKGCWWLMVVGSGQHKVMLRGEVDVEGRKVRRWWGWAICPTGGGSPPPAVAIPPLDKGTPELLLVRGSTKGVSSLGRRAWDAEVASWAAVAAMQWNLAVGAGPSVVAHWRMKASN